MANVYLSYASSGPLIEGTAHQRPNGPMSSVQDIVAYSTSLSSRMVTSLSRNQSNSVGSCRLPRTLRRFVKVSCKGSNPLCNHTFPREPARSSDWWRRLYTECADTLLPYRGVPCLVRGTLSPARPGWITKILYHWTSDELSFADYRLPRGN